MQLHIEKNTTELCRALADWIIRCMDDVLKKQDRFTWALSGGNSPKQLYELLAQSPYREKISWDRVHIFFGDERFVPFGDSRNNGKMAYDTLLNHVPIPKDHIHYISTDLQPDDSAAAYEKLLHDYFDHSEKSFDLVLLGMGEDGHTLSLFPHSNIIDEQEAWVKAVYVPDQEMYRITLTAFIVNRASRVAMLVTGSNKASTLKQVLEGEYDPHTFPVQIIDPQSGELHWFADEAAAALLKKA